MATLVIASVSDESGMARLEVDYDETSDPADWSLIAGRVVNSMTRPCFVLMRRGSGQKWLERQIDAGSTVSQDAGGPVQTLGDLPQMSLRT